MGKRRDDSYIKDYTSLDKIGYMRHNTLIIVYPGEKIDKDIVKKHFTHFEIKKMLEENRIKEYEENFKLDEKKIKELDFEEILEEKELRDIEKNMEKDEDRIKIPVFLEEIKETDIKSEPVKDIIEKNLNELEEIIGYKIPITEPEPEPRQKKKRKKTSRKKGGKKMLKGNNKKLKESDNKKLKKKDTK